MHVLRLWNTVRHLRSRQVAAQLRHRLRARIERPERFARAPVPAFPGVAWRPREAWLGSGAGRNPAGALRTGEFVFLNRGETLGFPPRTWEPASLPLLWRYNLHYFEWLDALSFPDGAAAVRDWIESHELARGRTGWDPYPTSLRIEAWCAYFFARHREEVLADAELTELLWASLHRQLGWLASHLEHHLMGNHLLENAAALAFAGACFAGAEATAWRSAGLALLARELDEQVLPDGGHFERSPLYQARIVWLLRALAWTGDAELVAYVASALERARRALAHLCHPDGEIALLNDSAIGIANPPSELGLPETVPGCFALPETGYYGAREAAGHYLVCDAAPVGPDYIPGHAHGDLLAFELSLAGQRVVVDTGVYDYESGETRALARSTAAHNTVELDGVDQCEFWGAFRVARRGRPEEVEYALAASGFALSASHDGYERLASAARHRRTFRWHSDGVLLVRDRIAARSDVEARSRIHLHPDCRVEREGSDRVVVQHPGGCCRIVFAGAGELSLESAPYYPEFGVVRQGTALCLAARGSALELGFAIAHEASQLGYDLAAGADVDGTRYGF